MRITQSVMQEGALLAMRSALARLAQSQSQLATGRRIQSPADDPAGHAAATRLEARRAAAVQFKRQADQAESSLSGADDLLQRLQPILGRAAELAVEGASDSKGPVERASMAAELDALLEEAVHVGNTVQDGRYLLGGQETLTAPLTATRNAAGRITAVAWNPRGVDDLLQVEVAQNVTVQTNVGGTVALGADTDPTFLPQVLIALRDALAANDPTTARATIAQIDTAAARVGNAVADVGGRLRVVEQTQTDLDSERLAAETALSGVLDADLARVAADLSQRQIGYQAALQAGARAIQPSLMDFLR